MITDNIRRDEEDDIIVLTFTRDTKRNAVTPRQYRAYAKELAAMPRSFQIGSGRVDLHAA